MSQSKKGLVWVMSVALGVVVRQYSVSQVWHFVIMADSSLLFQIRKATVWVHSFLSPLRPIYFYVPRGLTSESSAFCSQRVSVILMGLRTKSDHLPVVVYNRLSCVTDTEFVFCMVRTEYLNITVVNFRF